MTQQTHGMPELKYSEETFRDMYEALKAILERTDKGLPLSRPIHLDPAKQALAKAEDKE